MAELDLPHMLIGFKWAIKCNCVKKGKTKELEITSKVLIS